MRIADNKVVLFIDLLGFAALTEKYPVDLDLIAASERLTLLSIDTILEARRNRLTGSFVSFHRALKGEAEIARMQYPFTIISFSDSAFIVTERLHQATGFAIRLLQTLLAQEVPIRAGIGYGSFAAVRFSSDVTTDIGDHEAHFLGTGVIRAHSAETCGVKGMRILLHPSVMPLLAEESHNPAVSSESHISCVDLPPRERENKAGILCEVDYWSLRPTTRTKAWHSLQDLWDAAPESAQAHYQSTAEAIDRMRVRQGQKPLDGLRRRTLPNDA